jgi:2-oxoglutarate ferredoxin oxidoreductase subunit alpha
MEPVEFQPAKTEEEIEELNNQHLDWCMHPNEDEPNHHHHVINSLELDPNKLSKLVLDLENKYKRIEENEIRYEEFNLSEDNEILCVAFGTAARITKSAIEELAKEGKSVGLIRPVTLWPYPYEAIKKALHKNIKKVIVFELNLGQMIEDVRLAVEGKVPVEFLGKVGGLVFTPEDAKAKIEENL